ncbi:MAG: hypothetical protein EA352_00660, partial [Gemmatimonadales bacterium]
MPASPSPLDAPFPDHLHGRIRRLDGQTGPIEPARSPGDGGFILYWMRTAARAHENPALDAALHLGRRHHLPVFVYHALSERYPWASDRHHTFILEGARDVQAELRQRGIGTAFHLERPGHRGPHLLTLAQQASVVVTEESFMGFLRRWTRTLANRAAPVPVVAVEAALPFPLHRLDRAAAHRAFRFRKAHAPLWNRWLTEPWPQAPHPAHPDPAEGDAAAPEASSGTPSPEPFVPKLPFEPIDLSRISIPQWVARCDIDHGVGPVPHTRGGSMAGYARWEAFLEEGLAGYARHRNDPLRQGVSRMSAYLHYGHVSPFRLMRDAHGAGRAAGHTAARRKGADKYLDELLVWRGLAHAHTWLVADPDDLSALPEWAVDTLSDHASDPRPALLTWEQMARARTGD